MPAGLDDAPTGAHRPIGLVLCGASGGSGEGNFIALATGDRVLAREGLPGAGLAKALPEAAGRIIRASFSSRPDFVAVITGPGSFTGLRATLALGIGYGQGRGIPVKGVGLRAALAETLKADVPEDARLLVNGRRGHAFCVDGADNVSVAALDGLADAHGAFPIGDAVDGPSADVRLRERWRAAGVRYPFAPTPSAVARCALARPGAPLAVYGEGARLSRAGPPASKAG